MIALVNALLLLSTLGTGNTVKSKCNVYEDLTLQGHINKSIGCSYVDGKRVMSTPSHANFSFRKM